MDTSGPILAVMPSWIRKEVLQRIRHDEVNGIFHSEDSIRAEILLALRWEITRVIDHPLGRP